MIIQSLNMEPDPVVQTTGEIWKERLLRAPEIKSVPAWHFMDFKEVPIGLAERKRIQFEDRKEHGEDNVVQLKHMPSIGRTIPRDPKIKTPRGGFPPSSTFFQEGAQTETQTRGYYDYI